MKKFKLGLVLLSLVLVGCSSKTTIVEHTAPVVNSTPVSETSNSATSDSTDSVTSVVGYKGDTLITKSGVQITLDDVVIANTIPGSFEDVPSKNGNFVIALVTIYNGANSEVKAYSDYFVFTKGEKKFSCIRTWDYDIFGFLKYEYNGLTYEEPSLNTIQPEETYHLVLVGDFTEATSTDPELLVHFIDVTISKSDATVASFVLNQ